MDLLANPVQTRFLLLSISLPLLVIAVIRLNATVEDDYRRDAAVRREKRREKRAKRASVFDLEDGRGGYTPHNARLVDISFCGACVSTALVLKVGQTVRGRIHSVEGGMAKISGVVKWMRKRDNAMLYGIGFDHSTRVPAETANLKILV
jgi:hypothetical protein